MLRTCVLAGVFVLSGASALVFETLWFHQAALLVGSTLWAASLVLSAFMAGMAAGNLGAALRGDRAQDGIRVYAGLELVVAISGVALVYLLPALGPVLAPLAEPLAGRPALLQLLRFCTAFALLLLPAAAMGMSLPLLVRAAGAWDASFGRVLGLLYGANTLGAVAGAILSELLLLPLLGIRGSALCAGALSGLAAVLALGFRARAPAPAPAATSGAVLPRGRAAALLLAAACGAGLLLLALEVVWLRFLVLFLNDTPLAFAVVLALVLAGIALGSLLASLWASLSARAGQFAWLAAYAGGLFGLGGYLLYPLFLRGSFPPYQPLSTIVALAAPLVLPTSLASGALFTLLGARLRRFAGSDAATAGALSFANTIGAGIGPLLAGFVLLPQIGMERALLGAFVSYGLLGLALSFGGKLDARVRYGSVLLFAAGLAFFPLGLVRARYIRICASRWTRDAGELVGVRESASSTLLHVVHREHGAPLFDQVATNAYSMSVNGFYGRRYMKLFVYLPVALHPKPERALLIGFGIGNTAKALTDTAALRRIDVVDVSRDMLDASRQLRVSQGRSPLDDPRVHVRIEDGRFFLQSTSARYDLITGEPPPPIIAGVVNLYTTEYFRLVHDRLAQGGIATYWLPVMNISATAAKSVIHGFCDAFADCSLWHGSGANFMLMGTRGARGPGSDAAFERQWQQPAVLRELVDLGFEVPAQLAATFIGDARYLRALSADSKPLTDDRPKRLQHFIGQADLEPLIAQWHDPRAAAERFHDSAWVAALFPAGIRAQAPDLFQVQWLIDELLSSDASALHNSRLLHQLLFRTRLKLPLLLLLGSSPDLQDALARMPPAQREEPAWLLHRAAGKLADRDLPAALALLQQVPREQLPIKDLREYLAYAVRRTSAAAAAP